MTETASWPALRVYSQQRAPEYSQRKNSSVCSISRQPEEAELSNKKDSFPVVQKMSRRHEVQQESKERIFFVGNIGVLDNNRESWVVYHQRFKQFVTCNTIADGQVSTLLTVMDPKAHGLLHNLLSATVPGTTTFASIAQFNAGLFFSYPVNDSRTISVSSSTLGKWKDDSIIC